MTLTAKLCWRMENSNNAKWAEDLKKKYRRRAVPSKGAKSRIWVAITKGSRVCEKGSKWSIGSNSNLSFWNDKWLNFGTIRSLIEGPLLRGEEELLVKDVMVNRSWDLNTLSFDFNDLIRRSILATPLRRISQREDQLCWISNSNGEFDSKNAYLLAIGENPESPDFHGKWLWKLNMPPKIQVFL